MPRLSSLNIIENRTNESGFSFVFFFFIPAPLVVKAFCLILKNKNKILSRKKQYKWIMKANYYKNVSLFTATIKPNCITLTKPNCQIQNYHLV